MSAPGTPAPSAPVTAPLRVYCLAAGAIAVPLLAALHADARFVVVGLGTQVDRPSGRHRLPTPTAVGAWAHAQGHPVSQLDDVNAPAVVAAVQALAPDFLVVFAFGQLLAPAVLAVPRLGSINVHASLLPRHRGAAPVSAAILAGDAETGISVMRMAAGLDRGPVYAQFRLPLSGREYAPELEARLAALAAAHTGETLVRVARGELTPCPQADGPASYARKLSKDRGQLKWTLPAVRLERMVRAFHPWPGAWFTLTTPKGARRLRLTAAAAVPAAAPPVPPGTIVQADRQGWAVQTAAGVLQILNLVPEGRSEMSAVEFLRGSPLHVGDVL